MEKDKLSYRTRIIPGTSLKELIPFAVERHKTIHRGQPLSERIRWLSTALESEDFWIKLNQHMDSDEKEKRHSIGGIFVREYGSKKIDIYTWEQIYSSLDNFLSKFDMRATEFLFRDFQPENPSVNLTRIINATRELSIEKYPRLRRLYWDDYQKAFETHSFWYRLNSDLTRLEKPLSVSAFFTPQEEATEEQLELRQSEFEIRDSRKPRWTIHGPLGKKVRFIEYHNLAQITRVMFNQDPRTFLLNYQQKSNDKFLAITIREAKTLLERKILPVKPKPEAMIGLSKKEFDKLINSKEFWLSLLNDLTNHLNSQKPTYSLSFFLRHYDKNINEINPGKLGAYATLMTTYMHEFKDLRKRLVKPSKKMVQYLMWNFAPSEEISPMVTQVKNLCAELFPQDCLYVALQTPNFWKQFESDITTMQGNHTLASFLRYFSEKNPNCDRRLHHRYQSKYQSLLYRAYHKKKSFLSFLSSIEIREISDYKDGLAKLFQYTAPPQIRELLFNKFPKDFDWASKTQQLESDRLFQRAKKALEEIKISRQIQTLSFKNKDEALAFREKIWSATRNLKLNVVTELKDNILTVKIGKRIKFPPKSRVLFEAKVLQLKQQKLSDKEIAAEFGTETKDYHIEYAVRKLVERGELKPRK